MVKTRSTEKIPLLRDDLSPLNYRCSENDNNKESEQQEVTSQQSCVMWLGFIFYACGITMGMAVMRQCTYKYVKDSNNETVQNESSSAACEENVTSSMTDKEAANWLLYFELTEYTIVLPVVALCGIYSDFIGRKPFIIVSLLGGVIEYTCFVAFIFFQLPLKFMFIGYVIGGLTGSEHVLFMSCSAAIADTTDENESRSFYFALLYFCFGLGVTVSQLVVGVVIKYYGFVIPNIIAASIIVIALAMFSVMPETYTKRNKRTSVCKSLSRIIGFYHDKTFLKRTPKWKFVLCLFGYILFMMPGMSRAAVETLYQLGKPFCFTSEEIGYYSAIKEFAQLSIATLMLRGMHVCLRDEIIIFIGVASSVVYFTIESIATEKWMIYLGKCLLLF